jgi:predicted negative regulator of RcsB-dependent stress response
MPKAIKKKVTKPVKTEEGMRGIISRLREMIAERQKLFFSVVVSCVILCLALAGFFMYRSNARERAEALEYEGYKLYYGMFQKQPLQKEGRHQGALEKFRKAYELRKSPYSLSYIANCYYDMGNYDEALKALKELNERFPDDERFVPLTYYKMAVINLRKGDREAALKLLNTLSNYKTASFKDLALIESGRILESMGQTGEAAKKYEEIMKNFPASPFVEEARTKLSGKKTPEKS